jgi:hypothetical protein
MKTTFDLPKKLVRELKIRAARDGRKVKDVAADCLSRGLSELAKPNLAKPIFTIDKSTGFPVIKNGRAAPAGQELTPDRISEILIEQEAQWIQ